MSGPSPQCTKRYSTTVLFNSFRFAILFLPLTFAGFFLIGRFDRRAAALFLGLASLVFFASWDLRYLPLLLGSITFNYLAGSTILRARDRRALVMMLFAVSCNIMLLGIFKYTDFFIGNINWATDADLALWHIVLPLGISFYTFTQIAFLVDAYRGEVRDLSPANYLLFVTFFPHLIAGPILHHGQMMPQFARPEIYSPRSRAIAIGLAFFLLGMAKKVLLADTFAIWADPIFDRAETEASLTFAAAWVGALSYALQIYFDFSGYSDMAVGLAKLFNIDIPYNFNSPYKSASIIDFWRRWHMTLSAFLRDYVYFSLGGNRRGSRYVNLLATMLIGGLWHGASWTFVFWGGLHGVYLVVNHVWQRVSHRFPSVPGASMFGIVLTLFCVVVAWVFFRALTFAGASRMLTAMVDLQSMGSSGGLGRDLTVALGFPEQPGRVLGWLALGLAICWLLPNSQQLVAKANERFDHWRWSLIGSAFVILLILLAINASRGESEFIYFNF